MASRRLTQLFLALSGMIAWAVQFTVIYGATSTLCERGWADFALVGINIVPLVVVGATAVALAATAYVLWQALGWRKAMQEGTPPADRFLVDTTVVVSGLSLVSILWQGLPGVLVPPCY
ncbi:MAG TPA: hypothetical protein VGN97_10345 [Mesorhizobium sp.]|nr:hypothetical protein [Mesorhizobium sp.]